MTTWTRRPNRRPSVRFGKLALTPAARAPRGGIAGLCRLKMSETQAPTLEPKGLPTPPRLADQTMMPSGFDTVADWIRSSAPWKAAMRPAM